MTSSAVTRVTMPQLGESVVEGTVSRWLKQPGEAVAAYEALLEVSTDKVETEIPSPAAGVLLRVLVAAGETVAKGTLLAEIGPADAGHTAKAVPAADAEPAPEPASAAPSAGGPGPHVTPVVARMAAEHGLDLTRIAGTGQHGRVTKKDVEAYLAGQTNQPATAIEELPPWERPGSGDLFKATEDYAERASAAPIPPAPAPASAPVPHGSVTPLTTMRRAIAEAMTRSLREAPQATTIHEADLTAVLAHQRAHEAACAAQGVRLTLTAYFAAAIAAGVRAVPLLNARWTEAGLAQPSGLHLGIAVAVPDGLLVPVIRDADGLNLLGLARAVNRAADRARGKALTPDELTGGTFTLSNHGVGGSLCATPILSPGQTGILGVGALEKRVKVIAGPDGGDVIAVRPCVYLSLTFDHRVVDGAAADAFVRAMVAALASPA